tara:strand:+ start:74 stop:358 length:285 start_codon:yes stop_codon:yes gene_type:complete
LNINNSYFHGDRLEELRERINQLDSKILELLNKRAIYVKKIGKIKQKNKLDVEVPEREAELLKILKENNKGPLTDQMVARIFQEIIDTLKILQK